MLLGCVVCAMESRTVHIYKSPQPSKPLVITTTNRLSYHARWRRLGLTLDGLRTNVHSVTASAPSPQRVEIQVNACIKMHCPRRSRV